MVVGENGILNRATDASEKTKLASEKEAIEFIMTEMKMNSYTGEESNTSIGKNLYDRNVENGSRWHIIYEKKTGKTYGTGCVFIPKGSNLGNGTKSQSNWLIDIDGNLKELADDSFTELDFSSTVGITDGLILNMDSSNLENGKDNWGDNITLRYFDNINYDTVERRTEAYTNQVKEYISVENNDNGYDRLTSENTNEYFDTDNKAFKFKGNNYIEIYDKDGFDFSKGLTFEFYGKFFDEQVYTLKDDNNSINLFSIWDGVYGNNPPTRFQIMKEQYIGHCLWSGYNGNNGAFALEGSAKWGQFFDFKEKGLDLKNDVYLCISLNPDGENNEAYQVVSMNNVLLGEGWLNKEYFDYFKNGIEKYNYLDVGRVAGGTDGNWMYLNGLCYCVRLYNKALNKEEILTNYNKTIAYRELMKNGN